MKLKQTLRVVGFIFFALMLFNETSLAEDSDTEYVPTRFGFALSYGNSVHPDNKIGFILANYMVMFDYDKIWPHSAPENLRFKLEFSLGSTTTPDNWAMASASMLALYYLDFLDSEAVRPYIEGGIGLIYTGFRVEGQGSHLNFNPKAGFGFEFPLGRETLFTALRWDHLSNAGLSHDNTSVDSVILMFGAYF
ncbi:MAG: acyloxyacyl hydrolase [Deltaproteobacteria bacterium]|nr:acyloxyacyl hydrolase [Deltaproteobacteria bacterium]